MRGQAPFVTYIRVRGVLPPDNDPVLNMGDHQDDRENARTATAVQNKLRILVQLL